MSLLMEPRGLEVYGLDALVDNYEMIWYIIGVCCLWYLSSGRSWNLVIKTSRG
jgi:hypothetical protein